MHHLGPAQDVFADVELRGTLTRGMTVFDWCVSRWLPSHPPDCRAAEKGRSTAFSRAPDGARDRTVGFAAPHVRPAFACSTRTPPPTAAAPGGVGRLHIDPAYCPPRRNGVLGKRPNVRLVTAVNLEQYRRLMLAALD